MPVNKKSLMAFDLIKSLTPGEKRYFKMFVSTFERTNKTYIKLFNAIDKQSTYDEKTIKTKFKNESFVKHFAVVKSNLCNTILKSLRFYHSENNPQEKVNQHMSNSLILVRKGKRDLASYHLKKALKVAEENSLFTQQLEILNWSNHIMFRDIVLRDSIHENPLQQFSLPLQHLKVIKDLQKSIKLEFNIRLFRFKNLDKIRTKKSHKYLKKFVNKPLLKFHEKSRSPIAQEKKLSAKFQCYLCLKDYEQAFITSQNMIKLTNYMPKPQTVLSIHADHSYASLRIKSWKTTKQILNKCLELYLELAPKIKFTNPESKLFEMMHFCELLYHLFHLNFDAIINTLPKVEKEYSNIEDKTSASDFWTFNYHFSYGHFIIGEYENAQSFIVKLLNKPVLKNRKDYFIATQILNLFIHYL